jgi:hypothetical protein
MDWKLYGRRDRWLMILNRIMVANPFPVGMFKRNALFMCVSVMKPISIMPSWDPHRLTLSVSAHPDVAGRV